MGYFDSTKKKPQKASKRGPKTSVLLKKCSECDFTTAIHATLLKHESNFHHKILENTTKLSEDPNNNTDYNTEDVETEVELDGQRNNNERAINKEEAANLQWLENLIEPTDNIGAIGETPAEEGREDPETEVEIDEKRNNDEKANDEGASKFKQLQKYIKSNAPKVNVGGGLENWFKIGNTKKPDPEPVKDEPVKDEDNNNNNWDIKIEDDSVEEDVVSREWLKNLIKNVV